MTISKNIRPTLYHIQNQIAKLLNTEIEFIEKDICADINRNSTNRIYHVGRVRFNQDIISNNQVSDVCDWYKNQLRSKLNDKFTGFEIRHEYQQNKYCNFYLLVLPDDSLTRKN